MQAQKEGMSASGNPPSQAGVPGPSRPDDLGGDADFHAAASKALASDHATARSTLESFLAHHPEHRQRTAALALLARVQIEANNPAGARATLEGAKATLERAGPPAPTSDITFLSAIAASRLGNAKAALGLLRPFLASGPPLIGGETDADAPLLMRAAAAEAMAATGDPVAAIEQWNLYRSAGGVSEHERAYARQRAEEVAEKV
jgi:hypothetical protein